MAHEPSQPAILLLGPTGSGKTPLGQLLSQCGLWRRRCHHFDFGAELRRAVASKKPLKPFTKEDISVIRLVLSTGALLNDRQFGIAMKTLTCFLSRAHTRKKDIIVLNGLPRHTQQAKGIGAMFDIGLVVFLSCSGRCVIDRIACNAGGDRTDRIDDSRADIAAKLLVFKKRTRQLIAYYRRHRVPVKSIKVEIDTKPADILRLLQTMKSADSSTLTSGGTK
ncbi:MAG: nucleoside monophosphate kinase [bacterium]